MYEEKTKRSLDINWKSLIIKMAILLVALFIIIWIVSIVNNGKKKTVESNLSVNLQSMKAAATEYFTGSRLPSNINGKKKVTLGEMFDSKLLVEFKDQNNHSCDTTESYAEATKINSTDYTIKTKLVCGSESDYIIHTVQFDENIDTPVTNEPVIDEPVVEPNTNTNTNTNTNVNSNTTVNQNNSSNKKPNTNTSTTKPNTNTNTNSNSTSSTTCSYGKKEYTSYYPLAYVIPGNCAVSKNDYYKAEYSNAVSTIGANEYKKLNNEMISLANKTGATLYLDTPQYSGVYNKTNNGLVGYQILFTMKQKVNYVVTTVYQYYIDQNGNRTVVTDKRNSISNTGSTSTVRVTSVSLNQSSISLDVDETYTFSAKINPSNATNKTVSWSSSNTRVAKVNSNGRVTALREGTTTITATVDGKSVTAKVYVYEGATYRYCATNSERVYSTGYIDLNTIRYKTSYSTTYQVYLSTTKTNFYSLEYGNLTYGDQYASAYSYWKNSNKKLFFVGDSGKGIDSGSYVNLINHSLKEDNFTPYVRYVKQSGNKLYFDITINLKKLNNIKYAEPFYTTYQYGVYFLPLYFDVITLDYNDCKTITSSQIKEYERNGYVEI